MVAFLFSCSPEKRLSRLIRKYPQLVDSDTIKRLDTVIVNGTQHDTIFRSSITKDTVVIRENNLTVKYYNDGKTTYLKGVCDTIKIIREVPFIVNTVSPIKEVHVMRWWDYIIYAIAGLAILFVILDSLAHKLSK
jgi:adenosylcobinamide amidohydrolase